jgi:hypothetical protein
MTVQNNSGQRDIQRMTKRDRLIYLQKPLRTDRDNNTKSERDRRRQQLKNTQKQKGRIKKYDRHQNKKKTERRTDRKRQKSER